MLFAEVSPVKLVCSRVVAVTVRLSGAEADICNGAVALEVMLTDFTYILLEAIQIYAVE